MTPTVIMITTYLLVGLITLACLYRFNSKVKQNIKDAPYELFNRLANKGTFISLTAVKVVMYPAIWLFWVFILVGMVQGKYEGRTKVK